MQNRLNYKRINILDVSTKSSDKTFKNILFFRYTLSNIELNSLFFRYTLSNIELNNLFFNHSLNKHQNLSKNTSKTLKIYIVFDTF